MNRRRITLLLVTAAVLLAGVLLGSVWFTYFRGMSASFTLPPPLPSGALPGVSASGADPGQTDYTPLTVDAGNIQALLLTVARMEEYTQTVECVYHWPGGSETAVHRVARRGGLARVETRHEDGTVQNRIITPSAVYMWTGDAMPYSEAARADADADALSGIPTWETVAFFPPGDVLYAESAMRDGELCLLVRTQEPVYLGEYTVSLETGLLAGAVFTGPDGQIAYEVKAGPPEPGDPGNGFFTLPDGRLVGE